MTKNTQNHVGETSAFTLPSTRKPQQEEQQEEKHSSSIAAPLHEGEESNRSPSLPWLVEYWSSSLCRAPEMVLDNLCSCKSAVDPMELYSSNSMIASDNNNNKSKYFDDTILRSDPKVDRSPTKISKSRWDELRSVVASQGDYCDLYDEDLVNSMEETKEDLTTSIYPVKKSKKSLVDDMELDDDIREGPQELNTCQSFDLCATPTRASRNMQPASPPIFDRRRNRLAHPIAPRTLGFQNLHQRMNPPSPDHSMAADTYTTISLSQSFAREFDEDDLSVEGNLFLDRLASETVPSPFRRLRPRTTQDETKNEENERPSTPTRKRSTSEEDKEQYRCLVRMSPDNYKHDKTWLEEFPESGSVTSANSSVLLPLHPHQRIMEPLSDISGYPCFREQANKRRITIP